MAGDIVLRRLLLDPLQVGTLTTTAADAQEQPAATMPPATPSFVAIAPIPPVSADDSIGLSDLLVRIWRGKWLILLVMLAGLVAGVLFARGRPVLYTAELQVTPAVASPRSGGGVLGTYASLAGLTGSSTATSFDLYVTSLTSRAVANELARDPRVMHQVFAREWDAQRHLWHPVPDALAGVRDTLGLPRPEWHIPDGARLQDYLVRTIKIGRGSANSPITTVGFTFHDPVFAANLLNRMNDVADRKVRAEDLARARSYIAYLQTKLALVTQSEQRTAIVGILSDQERSAMTASSGLSYAAQEIEPAPVPRVPSSTGPLTIVAVVLAGCLLLGVLLALVDWRDLWLRVRRG